jgi:hypothetical protein
MEKTSLERMIEVEDALRDECKSRFPTLDSIWAVNRYMENVYNSRKKIAEALIPMMGELIRSQIGTKES